MQPVLQCTLGFLAAFVALVVGARQARAEPPAAQEKQLMPPLGKELSRINGVSLIRIDRDKSGYGSSVGIRRASFTAASLPLRNALESVTGVHPDRIIGASMLPAGNYSINIAVRGDQKKLESTFFQALDQAFALHVSHENHKMKLLVLSTAENWPRVGFKALRPRIVTVSTSGWQRQGDARIYTFHQQTIDQLVAQIQQELGRVVLNETNLKGRFNITMKVPEVGGLPDFSRALAEHGLRLQGADRELDSVVIESKAGGDHVQPHSARVGP
jgi:uncharacterized protein (TIGR03435 family)